MEENEKRELPETEEKHPARKAFNMIRNVFVLLTAICFIASFFLHEHHLLIRGIGYCMGFGAYFAELLELTEGFNRKKHLDDLFMAICFGALYVVLAITYILEHFDH